MAHDHDHSPISRDHPVREPSVGDQAGEGAGGAALGSAGGPVGALIGGLAGAVGGWWAGRSVSDATAHYTHEDDRYYRTHYDADASRPDGMEYERARTGYAAGHIAGLNPDYRERDWKHVAGELRSEWRDDVQGPWEQMEARVRHGWEHARHRIGDLVGEPGLTDAPGLAERDRLRAGRPD